MAKCPYCGRKLRENERYCDFCEQDIGRIVDEAEKPDIKASDFKKDIEKVKRFYKTLAKISRNIGKKLKK